MKYSSVGRFSVCLFFLACLAPVGAFGQDVVGDGDSNLVFEPAYFQDSAPATALDMVERVPGFTIDGGDAVRGYSGAIGNVLIDGARPSTKNATVNDVLAAIPASQVARIELIRGERAGIDRQGVQLLANVVRKASGSVVSSYTLSAYAYPDGVVRPSLRFETSKRTSASGWEGSLLFSTNQDESGTGTRIRQNAEGEEIEQASVAIDAPIRGAEARLSGDIPLAGGTLRGNGSFAYQDYKTQERLAYATGQWAGTNAGTDDRIETTSGEIGAEWTRIFDEKVTAKLLLLGTRKDVATASNSDEGGLVSDYEGDSLANERILRIALSRPSVKGVGWEAGGEIAYNNLLSRARLMVDDMSFDLPNSDVKISEWRGELFARLNWKPSPAVLIEGTVRGEKSSLDQLDRSDGKGYGRDFHYLKPKVTLQWDMDRKSQLRLRVEREVGQLDFNDFASTASLIEGTVDAGNVDLRPQSAWVFEAAWERRFVHDGALTATLRHERIDNVVDRLPIGNLDAPGNIGRGTIDSASIGLSWSLEALGVAGGRINFDGEWRQSKVRDPVTGQDRSITAQAPFIGELHATLDRPKMKSTLALDVYFGQRLTYSRIDEVRRTSDQPYVSLKWTYRPTKRLTVETSAENILSRKRQRDRSVYAGPRDGGEILFEELRTFRSRPGLFLSLRYR